MKEKTIYIAGDGTEFEDRRKCEKYEKSFHGREKVLSLLQGLEDYCRSVYCCHGCVMSNLCDRLMNSDEEYGDWTEFTDLINKE